SCKLARLTTHVAAVHELTSNPSLQNARFLLQTRLLCKPAPPSRHSLALRAHRHRLSAVARKKMYALAHREMSRRARSLKRATIISKWMSRFGSVSNRVPCNAVSCSACELGISRDLERT